MQNNIYLVESPTQLMSAIEAKNYNKGKHFLIIKYGSSNRHEHYKQLKELVDPNHWDSVFSVFSVSNKYVNQLLVFFFVIKFKFKFKSERTKVYIGEYRNIFFCILAKALSSRKEVLLDDGCVTIMLQNKYFSKKKGMCNYYSNQKVFFVFLFFSYLFRFKIDDNPPDLFSVFNLKEWLLPCQKNERITLEPKKVEVIDEFYFFGAKYSEVGILPLNVELSILLFSFEYIEERYSQSFVYIAHRDDSQEKLSAISRMGITVKQLGAPCEAYFLALGCVPRFIGGFYTTSLISLPSMFEIEKVVSFDFSKYIDDENIKSNTNYIYDYLKDSHVDVIPVDLSALP
ncbi:hypothetical protein HC000_11585 [Pseudoalteromonas sp. MIP2626]|uniref:hypothetical protein n=1 Tax=Pseudoalteromonas sp. MIP2626 TaxID=2705464 RepID=UPI0015CD9935|nr:hypothetical protein [Pseudoalteromonas sp. MIP2626]NYR13106.1 hypothetical protein [Pseudoalteromonas sp. MIP2626]